MFGKTRLGKSNTVKLIAQSILKATTKARNVGQIIFDVDGEYANDNPQDNNLSLRSAYPDRCTVYALTPKSSTPSEDLRLNFYEQPEQSIKVLGSLLEQQGKSSTYIQTFTRVDLLPLEELSELPSGSERTRMTRKVQMYWAILHKAGYDVDERKLTNAAPQGRPGRFNPGVQPGPTGSGVRPLERRPAARGHQQPRRPHPGAGTDRHLLPGRPQKRRLRDR
jgi:hypothetical protein